MIRVPLGKYPVVNHKHLQLFPGEPWLRDMAPQLQGKWCTLLGLGGIGVGVVGGATTMLPVVAFLLFLGGVVLAVGGGVAWGNALCEPATQVCPECGTIMTRHFHRCPGCGFTARSAR